MSRFPASNYMDSFDDNPKGQENGGLQDWKSKGEMQADGMTITWPADGSAAGPASAAARPASRASSGPDYRELIERAQAGDREAFEDLVHRYDRDVLRIALNILHKTEDARDVYQEAFLKIYKNLHRFRFEC
ncbi:MAG: RNA polymerase sigma factor, partial [Candidatus Acidiferrales bacterium]